MDKLWAIVETENIDVEYDQIWTPTRPLLGFYLCHPEGPLIGLEASLHTRPREERCVFAEEIGHYMTAPKSNIVAIYKNYGTSTRGSILLAKDERNAFYWATSFLIPHDMFCQALQDGCRTAAELADYFDVTEWFVYRKLGFLKAELKQRNMRVRAHELLRLEIIPEVLNMASNYFPVVASYPHQCTL